MAKSNAHVNRIARTPKVHSVEVRHGYDIFQNGVLIGRLSGGTEVYVQLNDATEQYGYAFAARFKYQRPKSKATEFVFAVFERMTPAEYLEQRKTPSDIMQTALGFDNYRSYYEAREQKPFPVFEPQATTARNNAQG